MDKPKIAQKTPLAVDIQANKNYAWCSCGLSTKQPFCDGKHRGTGFRPTIVKFDEAKQVWWCGCKHTTNDLGLCDGSHKNL